MVEPLKILTSPLTLGLKVSYVLAPNWSGVTVILSMVNDGERTPTYVIVNLWFDLESITVVQAAYTQVYAFM